jgi:hypothetical protein
MFLPKCQIYWSDLLVVFTLSLEFFTEQIYWYFPMVKFFDNCLFTLFAVEIFRAKTIASKFEQEKFVIIKSTGKSDRCKFYCKNMNST